MFTMWQSGQATAGSIPAAWACDTLSEIKDAKSIIVNGLTDAHTAASRNARRSRLALHGRR